MKRRTIQSNGRKRKKGERRNKDAPISKYASKRERQFGIDPSSKNYSEALDMVAEIFGDGVSQTRFEG